MVLKQQYPDLLLAVVYYVFLVTLNKKDVFHN